MSLMPSLTAFRAWSQELYAHEDEPSAHAAAPVAVPEGAAVSIDGSTDGKRVATGACGRARIGRVVPRFRSFRARKTPRVLGLHPGLPVGPCAQRPGHRHPASYAVLASALTRAARARLRILLHMCDGGSARRFVPGPFCPGRPADRRTSDDRVALRLLALRLPDRRDCLCPCQGQHERRGHSSQPDAHRHALRPRRGRRRRLRA